MRGKVSGRTTGELVLLVVCALIILGALLGATAMIGFVVDLMQHLVADD